MAIDELADARAQIAVEYFRRVDANSPDLLDLMTDDVQIYFPKFGVGYGKAEMAEAARGLYKALRSIEHDFEHMNIMASGNHVIIEGFEKGVAANGIPWPIRGKSEGRFCNVFEFHELRISRVHIYVDPDFASADTARFLWGESVRLTRPPKA